MVFFSFGRFICILYHYHCAEIIKTEKKTKLWIWRWITSAKHALAIKYENCVVIFTFRQLVLLLPRLQLLLHLFSSAAAAQMQGRCGAIYANCFPRSVDLTSTFAQFEFVGRTPSRVDDVALIERVYYKLA